MFRVQIRVLSLLAIFSIALPVSGHGGGLDANGCHFKRSTGEYHCHRGGGQPAPSAVNFDKQGATSPNYLVSSESGHLNSRLALKPAETPIPAYRPLRTFGFCSASGSSRPVSGLSAADGLEWPLPD